MSSMFAAPGHVLREKKILQTLFHNFSKITNVSLTETLQKGMEMSILKITSNLTGS